MMTTRLAIMIRWRAAGGRPSWNTSNLWETDAELLSRSLAFAAFGGTGSVSNLFRFVRMVNILSRACPLYIGLPMLVAPRFLWQISGRSQHVSLIRK
jgi:hypothetical protein